jgi:hypothetical protein
MTDKPHPTSLPLPFRGAGGLQGRVAGYPVVVNSPAPASVYPLVGILRAWPGPVTEATCSRQA